MLALSNAASEDRIHDLGSMNGPKRYQLRFNRSEDSAATGFHEVP